MQLSAWTSSTEKTVIAASDAPQALPELSNEASSVAASKGFQQITGWQVHNIVTCSQQNKRTTKYVIASLSTNEV